MDLTKLTTIKITIAMKKYLYLFFVALFATMSFSLTSCGDDDDEPNNGGETASALTINGKKVAFDSYYSQLQKDMTTALCFGVKSKVMARWM